MKVRNFFMGLFLVSFTSIALIKWIDFDRLKITPTVVLDTVHVISEDYPEDIRFFMELIAEIESNGIYHVTNEFGMLGRYQFNPTTIRELGYSVTHRQFLSNASLQDSVMYSYMKYNDYHLGELIEQYEGTVINGVRISRAAILAGAHFSGTGGMRRYLVSHGNEDYNRVDAFGTSLRYYMSRLAHIDVPRLTHYETSTE